MRILLFFLALFVQINLWADNKVTLTAEGPEVVVEGDQFRLTYTVNTKKVKDLRAPAIKGFEVLMGPSRSSFSSTQIINGKMTSSSGITFTFVLQAEKAGDYKIPGAKIVADGKEVISNSLNIKVLPPDQDASSGSDGYRNDRRQNGAAHVSDKDLFVRAIVNKTSVYEQEALILTYKIYTRETQLGFNNVKLPDFKGFHSQEIERPQHSKWSQEHYQDRNYFTTIYRQFVLFPQQVGEQVIEPARFDASVAIAMRDVDPFEAFFNGGSNMIEVNKKLVTSRIKVNVKSLPSGKPEGFSGAVGQFNMNSTISSEALKANEAVTVKVKISGTGNIKLFATPEVGFPEDFEIYDPKVDNHVKTTTAGIKGHRSIEYLAIPRHAGLYKVSPIVFSYFDVNEKKYKTLKSEEFELKVEKGEGEAAQIVANYSNKEDVRVLGQDIRYIKLNDVELSDKDDVFFGSVKYWLWYVIPSILFVLIMVINRKQAAENANVARMKTKKANKVAIKRLKLAGKLLKDHKIEQFYDEVLKALWGYISDKLNIPVSLLSKDTIEETMKKNGVDEVLVKDFINVLNECEFARFAPGDANMAMDKVYIMALDIISKMENSIKTK